MAVGSRDLYDTLGVSRDASAEDIRRAYRELARRYHPDVNKEPGAEDRFKDVSEAYEVLRDPEARAQYDRGGSRRAGPGPGPGAGRAYGGYDDVRVDFGDGDGDFGDLFESLFGGRAGGRGGFGGFGGADRRGGDQEAEIELSLAEAIRGGQHRLSLGDGREFTVDVPPGVRDGQRIRLAGEGAPGRGGAPPGDLFLRVRLRPDPRFRVEGGDLYTDLKVSPWEAALGADAEVPTPTGEVRVKVPPGSSSGRRLRLRGEGLGGDLFAIVRIMVPPRLTDEERAAFERLAEVSSFDPRAAT